MGKEKNNVNWGRKLKKVKKHLKRSERTTTPLKEGHEDRLPAESIWDGQDGSDQRFRRGGLSNERLNDHNENECLKPGHVTKGEAWWGIEGEKNKCLSERT